MVRSRATCASRPETAAEGGGVDEPQHRVRRGTHLFGVEHRALLRIDDVDPDVDVCALQVLDSSLHVDTVNEFTGV